MLIDNRQPFAVTIRMTVAEPGKILLAALAAPLFYVIQYVEIFITTAAAQQLSLNTSATINFGLIEASAPAGSIRRWGPYKYGQAIPVGESLLLSGAAGVAAEIKVEGYIDGHKAS